MYGIPHKQILKTGDIVAGFAGSNEYQEARLRSRDRQTFAGSRKDFPAQLLLALQPATW
jgi:hypothetical protein